MPLCIFVRRVLVTETPLSVLFQVSDQAESGRGCGGEPREEAAPVPLERLACAGRREAARAERVRARPR